MKNDFVSNLTKVRGDEEFNEKNYQKAIISYNESLSYAESIFQMSLLFAKRSEVYFEAEKYEQCLKNIQLAKDYDFPIENQDELMIREKKCREKIISTNKTDTETNEKSISDFVKISYESHPKIPFIIDGIEVKSSEKYGNYLTTSRDLKTGDIIAIEKPLIKFLDKKFCYERCANCLRNNSYHLMPCDRCCDSE